MSDAHRATSRWEARPLEEHDPPKREPRPAADSKAPPSGAADHPTKAPPSGAADHPTKAPPSGAADHPESGEEGFGSADWQRFRRQQVDDPVVERRGRLWDRFRRREVDDPVRRGLG